jgi:hypothetical protein
MAASPARSLFAATAVAALLGACATGTRRPSDHASGAAGGSALAQAFRAWSAHRLWDAELIQPLRGLEAGTLSPPEREAARALRISLCRWLAEQDPAVHAQPIWNQWCPDADGARASDPTPARAADRDGGRAGDQDLVFAWLTAQWNGARARNELRARMLWATALVASAERMRRFDVITVLEGERATATALDQREPAVQGFLGASEKLRRQEKPVVAGRFAACLRLAPNDAWCAERLAETLAQEERCCSPQGLAPELLTIHRGFADARPGTRPLALGDHTVHEDPAAALTGADIQRVCRQPGNQGPPVLRVLFAPKATATLRQLSERAVLERGYLVLRSRGELVIAPRVMTALSEVTVDATRIDEGALCPSWQTWEPPPEMRRLLEGPAAR